MATKKTNEPTTALATREGDELAALLGDGAIDFSVDGLEEVERDDVKITALLFNLKGRDEKSGKLRQLDEYLLTSTEETQKSVRVAFFYFLKSHTFKQYDDAQQKNVVICSSHDRVTGTTRAKHPQLTQLAVGAVRNCEGCPDTKFYTDAKGKQKRNCSLVYTVFGAILDDNLVPVDAFSVRFSRTSAPAWKDHLNKHHIGKNPSKRGANVPLFAFECTLSLEVDKGGNYAVPVLTKGRVLPAETVKYLAEQARTFAELGQEYMKASERAEEANGAGDVVETTGTSSRISDDDFRDG